MDLGEGAIFKQIRRIIYIQAKSMKYKRGLSCLHPLIIFLYSLRMSLQDHLG